MKPRRWLLPILLSALTFAAAAAYLHPAVMVQLADQLWSCVG
ncbi:hypothetical protein [Roseateles sp. BYS87W]|uniref:Uncharacterized protein n=1 Tax=Pelomonas baiyunensis TaxID=3299026 RepID=A0ABW7GX93_9BURK